MTTFEEIIAGNWTDQELLRATIAQSRAAFESPEFEEMASETAFHLIAHMAIFHGVPVSQPVNGESQGQPARRSMRSVIAANLRRVLS